MKVECLEGPSAYKTLEKVAEHVYLHNIYYRGTEASIEKLLLKHRSAFHRHASVKIFVIRDGNDLVARFALIHDQRLSEYVQVSFFEALPGLGDLFSLIKQAVIRHFPGRSNIVVGLNGHLNYGAGILLNRFDEAPLFGLPYNPSYYVQYFKDLVCRKMVTFHFSMEVYRRWAESYQVERPIEGLRVRFMDKKNIWKESAIYTQLNNQAFINHPFWAGRDHAEDLELFYPFRFLLNNENLVFAEVHGKPVGFFLWYPDFNQLVSSKRDLNLMDVIRYRFRNPINTFRFTEIGIIPEYQRSPVALALITKALPAMLSEGYQSCEGGFIFEENKASMAFVKRILHRSYGKDPEPYRQFATFETRLT